MDKNIKPLLTDEEISKAMEVLNLYTEGDSIQKSADNELTLDQQIAELQRKKELQKSVDNNLEPSVQVGSIVKAVVEDLSPKFEAFANISKSILDSHDALTSLAEGSVKKSDDLSKALGDLLERVDTLQKSVQEIGNSPMGKLMSVKTQKGIERFPENKENGKETLSMTRDKRVILNRLMKSLDTEDGANRLGNVVGLIENGYVTEDNFGYLQKSIQNELGVDVNIVF